MSDGLRSDWWVVLAVISGGHFFSHFYLLALPPLFPLLRVEFGLTNTELGLIAAALSVGGLLQAPVGGVVDRLGAKWVFVGGLGITAGGIAVVGLGHDYPAILALSVVSGIGQSAFHPADYAAISAVTERHLEGRAFAIHTFLGTAGFAAAPLVVGALGLVAGWRMALVVVGLVGLAYAGFAAIALGPVAGAPTPDRGGPAPNPGLGTGFVRVLRRPGILAMGAVFLAMAFAVKGVHTFTIILAVDSFGLTESAGALLLTSLLALGAVGVLVGGVLADRLAPGPVIVGSLTVGAVLLGVIVAVGGAVGAGALTALFGLVGFFVTLVIPSRDRLVSGLAGVGSTGRSFGIVFTGGTVGALIGPVFLGALSDATTMSHGFAVIGVGYLVAGLLALATGRRWLSGERPASATR